MKRPSLGTVTEVSTTKVSVRLQDYARGSVVAHADGISTIGQPGDLIGIEGGSSLLIARIEAIQMFDTAFAPGRRAELEPVRVLEAVTIGRIVKSGEDMVFHPDRSKLPPLGAQVVGLTSSELSVVLAPKSVNSACEDVLIGESVSASNVPISIGMDALLTRHFAVLGASGQGKTHFVASVLQKLLKAGPNARIVIFDIHDEYGSAFRGLPQVTLKETVLGTNRTDDTREHFRIPYYSLGLAGLSRLILPSEKTQRPALNFAVDKLRFVESDASGSRLIGQAHNCMFGDGRPGNADAAHTAIESLKNLTANPAQQWPHMSALVHLAAEWAALKRNGRGVMERSAWDYGNVAPMLQRISRLIRDSRFNEIIGIGPSGLLNPPGILNYGNETRSLVDKIFGPSGNSEWNVHIVGIKNLPGDLTPYILGSLLELYAEELFRRGAGESYPTLLVLEEAHHYLRQIPGDVDTGLHTLAYERLAREGRKFQVSMLISTQRPSEVSPTVLAQCGTWAVFRLTNERDQAVVSSGSEQASRYATAQIPGLARGQMVMFGDALPLATKIKVARPIVGFEPSSEDASFADAWSII